MHAVGQLQPHLGHVYTMRLEGAVLLPKASFTCPRKFQTRTLGSLQYSGVCTMYGRWKRFQKNAGHPAQRLAALALRHLIFFLPASVL